MLMEWHQEGDYWVIGGFQDERMRGAQVRRLREKFYVPLDEFTNCHRQRFQGDPSSDLLTRQPG